MVHFLLRGLFLLMSAAVAALYAVRTFVEPGEQWKIITTVVVALVVAGVLIVADILTPRKRLGDLSGVFLGLIVGMLATIPVVILVRYVETLFPDQIPAELLNGIMVFAGVVCVFGAISLIIQTKDDFRFVVPYVEFAKQYRGDRPYVLDTSAIIDGRFSDIAETQVISGLVIVPRFVLHEMQTIADSSDKLKRARGRRGLDILAKLQRSTFIDVSLDDREAEGPTVDQQLVSLSQDVHGRLVTTDFNLAKVAQVRGVDVINVNDLAEALRPVVLPGEKLAVQVIKPGESPGQGVGYQDDGTMVVVEQGRELIGQTVDLVVTSVLQTAAGRMIFGRIDTNAPANHGDADPAPPTGKAPRGVESRRRRS